MNIAVLTPTYNRVELLKRLFKSLLIQKDSDFIWIIVDDGSTDNTESVVLNEFCKTSNFEIRYLKKDNGGKSAALNFAFSKFDDIDFFAIIDSDDIALIDCISIIREKSEFYYENLNVGAIFFRYKNTDGTILRNTNSKKMSLDKELIMTRYDHDAKYSKDDGCIGYYKRTIKTFQFPEYRSEKYVAPTVLQLIMADTFKIAFTNVVVGVAEYQNGGLTKSGRKLRLNNPLGMIHYCGLLQSKNNTDLCSRVKYSIAAQAYACYSHINKNDLRSIGMDTNYLKIWAWFPGYILFLYWKTK